MAESRDHNQFKLNIPERNIVGVADEDVILSCHLSPETSAVTMTIRWFEYTECIYLYKNGQVTERRGYEDRLSLNTQEMERGNVSLRMKNYKESDRGTYICQVIHGEQKEEGLVGLGVSEEHWWAPNYLELETQEKKLRREESAYNLDINRKLHHQDIFWTMARQEAGRPPRDHH
ncbi:selection and upkeep of intraepithelial T-cells protein 1-like isoform X1 [Esox lucius]|nr:selection and upkeep of intraepithelial T-cells protein 1-like isoform X1 [Esox lucius]